MRDDLLGDELRAFRSTESARGVRGEAPVILVSPSADGECTTEHRLRGAQELQPRAGRRSTADRERVARELEKRGRGAQAYNWLHCGDTLDFWCHNHEVPESRRSTARCCKLRACDACGHVRAARVRKVYEKHLAAWKDPKMLTLTIRNTPSLYEGRDKLRRGFKRIRRQRWLRDRLRGGLLVEEVTNQGNGWHMHLHCLIDARFVPAAKLRKEWRALTGAHRVHIEQVNAKDATRYALKYVQKAPRLTPEQTAEYISSTYGKRLVQPFGNLFGARAPKPLPPRCEVCGSRQAWKPYPCRRLFAQERTLYEFPTGPPR